MVWLLSGNAARGSRFWEPTAFEIKVTYRLSATALMFPPSRIVCLTEETVETLYLFGEQDRIVGISGYVVRPATGSPREDARERFHVGEYRQDPRTAAGSRPHVFRPPGGYRCRSHSPRDRGARVQPRIENLGSGDLVKARSLCC